MSYEELRSKSDELRRVIAILRNARHELEAVDGIAGKISDRPGTLNHESLDIAFNIIGQLDWRAVEAAAKEIRTAAGDDR